MKVAVVGASGIVGRALMTQAQMAGLDAVAISRHEPDIAHSEFVAADLLDESSCDAASSQFNDVTHVVYTALYEKPGLISGWQQTDQMQTNLSMLKNCMEVLFAKAKSLEHVALLQGTKAYGAHLGAMKIPGKESDDRVEHDNFYWLQEDYIKSQLTASVAYSIWRPQVVVGHGVSSGQGAPMNMLAAIGAYIAFCLYDGVDCGYPGGPNSPMEVVDAELLARAILFGLEAKAAQNQTFNVTNGDVMEWRHVWSSMTRVFGLPDASPMPFKLEALYEREDDWQRLVERFGLADVSLREFVGDSFYYADALFATGAKHAPPPALVSTIKLRQAGFNECLDSQVMFERWLQKLQMMNRLPYAP